MTDAAVVEPIEDRHTVRDRESSLRWQERALTQTSTQNTVLMTLAGGGLVLFAPLVLEPSTSSSIAKVVLAGLAVMLLSLAFGVSVVVNRTKSFRIAARVARAREKGDPDRAEELRCEGDALDKGTDKGLKWQAFLLLFSFAILLAAGMAKEWNWL